MMSYILQHSENWAELWGRPGGGAPMGKDSSFKKTRLDEALHYPKLANVVSNNRHNCVFV